ncbi:MAG: hypothetical protein V5A49_12085 [Haloarcula sp.]
MVDIPGEDDPDGIGNVFTEKSDYEPEEFDPDSLGPSPPKPTSGDFESDAAGLFVKLVIVFNIALLALSLGPMLAYFEGRVDLGTRVFLVGLIAFGYGTFRYIQFKRERESETDDGDGPADDGAETQVDEGTATGGAETADHNG